MIFTENPETLKKIQKKFKDRIASDLVDILELANELDNFETAMVLETRLRIVRNDLESWMDVERIVRTSERKDIPICEELH